MPWLSLLFWMLLLVLSPLLLGIINKTKAFFAGRRGAPVEQPYLDLIKLLRKGAVYSKTTTAMFRLSPIVGLAAVLGASTLVPLGAGRAIVAFPGDVILLAYLLGVARFITVAAAMDTGSSFEGMGASREVCFSALSEPALFFVLVALAQHARSLSLTAMVAAINPATWAGGGGAAFLLCGASLVIILLAENARIPVDDPNTHLELTMIHEVMILDHSGPDLGLIHYTAALKLGVMGTLVWSMVPIRPANPWLAGLAGLGGLAILAVFIGVLESSMARLRLVRVPQLLVVALALAACATVLIMRMTHA